MTTAPPRSTTLSPLGHRLFAMIWIGALIANFGNAVQAVGAAWLLTELGEPADVVALVQTATNLPIMLLALPAGAFADMHDRRRIMLSAQMFMLLLSVLLAALAFSHRAGPEAVLGLTFLLACGIAFFGPGLQASIGTLVPRHELASAVALNILAFNVARSLGPALGGVIVAAGGSGAAFTVNAASYVLVIAVLLRWRAAPPAPQTREPIHVAIGRGLKFVGGSPQLRTILVRAVTFTLAGSAAWALMPLVSRDLVQGGSVEFGLLLAALGVGAVLGAASATWFRQRFSSEALIRGAGLVYGGGCLLAATAPGLWATFVLFVIAGAGWVQALSGFAVAGQLWAPRPLVGRVTATLSSGVFGGLALGSWLWGHVANDIGVGAVLAASGALMVVLPLLGLLLPMPRHEHAEQIQDAPRPDNG